MAYLCYVGIGYGYLFNVMRRDGGFVANQQTQMPLRIYKMRNNTFLECIIQGGSNMTGTVCV